MFVLLAIFLSRASVPPPLQPIPCTHLSSSPLSHVTHYHLSSLHRRYQS